MIFNLIDIDNWSRKPYFEHYLNHVRCTYSMTADIDITLLRAELKCMGIKLYPALIYMITTVVNRHCEFRTCFDSEGRLGIWDRMSPSFTIFHEEDKTFSSIWTPFSEEFQTFYDRYLQETETYKNAKQLFPVTNEPPNTFPISSIPWVSFTGFNLNVYTGGTYLLPIFTMGKYHWQDKKILLPLSVQCHHAVCDGYHASLIFNELQELAAGCKSWLAGK
ncbi:chloramphenicol O-acetyltransferase type A [Paenibacillus algorifonticola]|uniref:Chloramphenicol O-acetyltransferase type A n=1 Tax=Paenibacillus algorifonticola TaxID=684063 RepID=A0A1I2IYJ8_9BACL|nr:type A chloramphenicol O-acetyltransferase [Paenibacillus algorifonticola]SFF47364.1 chloramphenicol O-acetyltransferase type A [Paenibacillus algorifonticola]